MSGPSAAGKAPPAAPTTESLKLLAQSYSRSIDLGFGLESGACTTMSPGSVTIKVNW